MLLDDDKPLLQKLIPRYRDPTFNDDFNFITQHCSKSRRFLIKMELHRLYNQCHIAVDLRGRVDGQCLAYTFEGSVHYLDDIATQVFEHSIGIFGCYSVGVYEAVTQTKNSFRQKQLQLEAASDNSLKLNVASLPHTDVNTQKLSNGDTQLPLTLVQKVSLTNFKNRTQQRINICIRVKVTQACGQLLDALVTNLSLNGTKLKLRHYHSINVGDILWLDFGHNLSVTCQTMTVNIPYRVISIHSTEQHLWLNLGRLEHQQDQVEALQHFITQKSKKYKANVSHILDAIYSQVYRDIHLNNMVGLPIFFTQAQEDKNYQAVFALRNKENQPILDYWYNHQHRLCLGALLSSQRLATLLTTHAPKQSLVLYCFNHIAKGRKYFYSATQQQLEDSGLRELFFKFGAHKKSWRVYLLSASKIDEPPELPPELLPAHLVDSPPISSSQQKHHDQLAKIKATAYLIDITNFNDIHYYQERETCSQAINELQLFVHNPKITAGIALIDNHTLNHRHEDRISYQTPVIIYLNRKKVEACIIDFSLHGMRVRLNQPLKISKGQQLKLTIPAFSPSVNHQEFLWDYQVVTADNYHIHLQLVTTSENSDRGKHLARIIKLNQHNFTVQASPSRQLTQALHLLYCQYATSLILMISKIKRTQRISHIVMPIAPHPLYQLLAQLSPINSLCDLSALAKNNRFKDIFDDILMKLTPGASAKSKELYLELTHPTESAPAQLVPHYFEQFQTAQQHRDFINTPRHQGVIFAIRVSIRRTMPINYDHLANELIYAATHSSYKSRQLKSALNAVIATAEIVDITPETRQRFHSSSTSEQGNNRA